MTHLVVVAVVSRANTCGTQPAFSDVNLSMPHFAAEIAAVSNPDPFVDISYSGAYFPER